MKTFLLLSAAALSVLVGRVSAAEKPATNLDQALQQQAPAIIKHLRDKKYKNVGVLKFLVKKNDAPLSDNVGPLNLSIANRLEVALTLANPDEELGIIERASATVAKANNKRANHRTKEGRQALFDGKYLLGWGHKEVSADGFVTGTAEFSPDLRVLKITVQAFGKQSDDLETVCTFQARTDPRTLAEAGESYLLKGARGGLDPGTLVAMATDSASDILTGKHVFPLEDRAAPVEMKVLYDGTEVPINRGRVPTPKPNQEVTFVLKNKGSETYGVVLMVNGESTIYRERLDPAYCYKWILDPAEQISVRGFQTGPKELVKFKVLTPEESGQEETNYGEHAGTFTLVVFASKKTVDAPVVAKDDASHHLAAISRGSLQLESKPKPSTLKVLQSRLKKRESDAADPNQRGLVVPGEKAKGAVRKVKFNTDPVPVMTCTIRYYQPKNR